jgi:hypothetical protein
VHTVNVINLANNKRGTVENILVLALNVPVAVKAAMDAVEEIGDLLSAGCFANPETLTHDSITAYALALVRVRECAAEAAMTRLTDACDALAVTVSRLIDDEACANQEKCEALTRFVVHAQAIIDRSVGSLVPSPVQSSFNTSGLADAYARDQEDFTHMFAPIKPRSVAYLPA